MKWNNRRRHRGAVLYDLLMAHRFDRERATERGVLTVINRAAAVFRDEDRVQREGRESWRDVDDALADHAWLSARVIQKRQRK